MHHSLVYTDDGNAQRRSPFVTLLLAILILAALSLAVWAGLHFYQRSQGQGQAGGIGQAITFQKRVKLFQRSKIISAFKAKEVGHDFAV